MSWNYSGDPADSSRDAVRFLCGQTSTGDPITLEDEEIAYAIAQTDGTYLAAALCCETLAARYRTIQPTAETIGDLSVTWGDRAKQLDAQAKALRHRSAIRAATPFLGGQSETDQEARQEDGDLRQPAFRPGRFDYPGIGLTGSTST